MNVEPPPSSPARRRDPSARYFLKTSSSRYVGMYSAAEIEEGMRAGQFHHDWTAIPNPSGSLEYDPRAGNQESWNTLLDLFGSIDVVPADEPAPKKPESSPATLPPAPPAAPLAAPLTASAHRGGFLKGTCKKCGAKKSLMHTLCPQCEKEEQALQLEKVRDAEDQKRRLEVERKRQVHEGALGTLDLIVKTVSDEPAVSYWFIHCNITKQGGGSTSGAVVGGLLGGVVGAMIGSALTSGSGDYSGEMGIAVLTPTEIIVHTFTSAFPTADGHITHEHLSLILRQIGTQKTTPRVFRIRRTQISMSTDASPTISLVNSKQKYSFNNSELKINGIRHTLPSFEEFRKQAVEAGALIPPSVFVEKILRDETPVSDDQLEEIRGEDAYFDHLVRIILERTDRDKIYDHFRSLTPFCVGLLNARLQRVAATYPRTKCVVWASVVGLVLGIVGIFLTSEFLCFLCWMLAISSTIFAIVKFGRLGKAAWCRSKVGHLPALVTPQPKIREDEEVGVPCVACGKRIAVDIKLCPHCNWAQPKRESGSVHNANP